MRCPVCKVNMGEWKWGEVEGHTCPICNGAWLNRENKWHIISAMPEKKFSATRERMRNIISLKCNGCSTKLEKVKAQGYYHHLTAYLCFECKGIFLNKVDFRLLKKKKLRAINAKTIDPAQLSNDQYYEKFEEDRDLAATEYLFAFFTGLPVEINVPPQKKPVLTYILFAMNIIVFGVLLFGDKTHLMNTFGIIPQKFSWHTLFTCMFLHGDWLHLLGNMYFLYIFGDNVEDRLGKILYLPFYFFCGIAATYVYILLNPTSSDPMVGASGAIAGLMGAYLLACTKAKIGWVIFLIPVKLPAFCYFFFWLVVQLILSYFNTNIAWEAHLGGFFCGVVTYPIFKYGFAKFLPK